jgi:F420H(2)-dependent quinone reductase
MGTLNITITTTGRRSGVDRTVPLYGFEDGDSIVVVGSRGGSAKDPAWAENLRADPSVRVQARGDSRPMFAREVSGDERARLWELAAEAFPTYRSYERRTRRLIPVFRLEPLGGG